MLNVPMSSLQLVAVSNFVRRLVKDTRALSYLCEAMHPGEG